MRRTRHSFTTLADTLQPEFPGLHRTKLHRIAQGKTPPDLLLGLAIEHELGVPVEAWPSLRPAVEELLRRRAS